MKSERMQRPVLFNELFARSSCSSFCLVVLPSRKSCETESEFRLDLIGQIWSSRRWQRKMRKLPQFPEKAATAVANSVNCKKEEKSNGRRREERVVSSHSHFPRLSSAGSSRTIRTGAKKISQHYRGSFCLFVRCVSGSTPYLSDKWDAFFIGNFFTHAIRSTPTSWKRLERRKEPKKTYI